jgi:hypothetical protein
MCNEPEYQCPSNSQELSNQLSTFHEFVILQIEPVKQLPRKKKKKEKKKLTKKAELFPNGQVLAFGDVLMALPLLGLPVPVATASMVLGVAMMTDAYFNSRSSITTALNALSSEREDEDDDSEREDEDDDSEREDEDDDSEREDEDDD